MCKMCGEDRAMMASRKDEKNSGANKRAAGGDWLNGKRTARLRAREENLVKW